MVVKLYQYSSALTSCPIIDKVSSLEPRTFIWQREKRLSLMEIKNRRSQRSRAKQTGVMPSGKPLIGILVAEANQISLS